MDQKVWGHSILILAFLLSPFFSLNLKQTPQLPPKSLFNEDACASQSQIPYSSCQALIKLFLMTYPIDPEFPEWNLDELPCSWHQGITCAPLDGSGLLDVIKLSLYNLEGEFPPELWNLTHLTSLRLSSNDLSGITGSLPPEIGNLQALEELYLYANLTGSLPSEIGNLQGLKELHLEYTGLSGPLPDSITLLVHLKSFTFQGTTLCEPLNADFQAWKATVSELWSGTGGCYSIEGRVLLGESSLSGVDVFISALPNMGFSLYQQASTSEDGSYKFFNLLSGSYTIIATKIRHYIPHTEITITNSSLTGVDIAARLQPTISGRVTTNAEMGLASVTIFAQPPTIEPVTALTDLDGDYTLYVDPGTYTLTAVQNTAPNGIFYFFEPISHQVTVADTNITDINFTGRRTYMVKGLIREGTGYLRGARISTKPGYSALSDGNGNFQINGNLPGTYTVVPSKANYIFDPPSRMVTITQEDVSVDFTAIPTPGKFYLNYQFLSGLIYAPNDLEVKVMINTDYDGFDFYQVEWETSEGATEIHRDSFWGERLADGTTTTSFVYPIAGHPRPLGVYTVTGRVCVDASSGGFCPDSSWVEAFRAHFTISYKFYFPLIRIESNVP